MSIEQEAEKKENFVLDFLGTTLGRILVSVFVPIITGLVLWQGFLFLRDAEAPKIVMTIIAIIWGVGGVLSLYFITNWLIQQLPGTWRTRLTPFLFVGPALIILTWYLLLPTIRSFIISLYNPKGDFIFITNYIKAFQSSNFLIALRNNLIWIALGPTFAVFFGLVIALLSDRSSFEVPAKAFIFMPMAISFIGAGVIWKFVYAYTPAGEDQIGLLNAMGSIFGGNPVNWLVESKPLNTVLIVMILVWMQTGYAMVLISSAIKGVPEDLLEAARIDGAGEFRIILSVIIPYIKGTIITVTTTITILTLKIFDIVYSMTGGNFDTDVLATLQYKEMFVYKNYNMGSTYAIILLIAVIPAVVYNLKQFRDKEAF